MGDVLLLTPVLEVLRDRFPKSRITILTDAPAHEVIQGHPALDEILVFKTPDDSKLGRWERFKRYARVFADIRRRRFDLVLNLHPHGERGGLVSLLSGAKVRVGYDRPGSRTFWYNVKAPYRVSGRYRVEHMLDALRAIGIDAPGRLPSIATSAEDRSFADSFHARGSGRVVVIHPGRPDTRRAWPADRYAALADNLVQKYRARVVFIGIPSENARVEAVMRAMREPAESLVGRATVKQVAAIMARSALFIGMDSSQLHVASAVGLPTVSLFSYYSPEDWKPPGDKHIAIRKQLPGRPCSPTTCCEPGKAPCMLNISVEDVLQAAARLLDRRLVGE